MVRDGDPAKRGAVVRCHPTYFDHHRRHGRSKHGAARLGDRSAGFLFSKQLPTFRQTEWYKAYINVRETFALQEVLKLATTTHPGCLKGSTTVAEVDNEAMHDVLKKRRSRTAQIYDLITKLFWL